MSQKATNTQPPAQTTYDIQATNSYYTQHDFDGPATLSTTVVHALSEVADVDVTNTDSTLFQHIDPDALNSLFDPVDSGNSRTTGRLSFTMWGHSITVHGDGRIEISSPQNPVQ